MVLQHRMADGHTEVQSIAARWYSVIKTLWGFQSGRLQYPSLNHQTPPPSLSLSHAHTYIYSSHVTINVIPRPRRLRIYCKSNIKAKAIPLQTWTCPEVSRRLRLLDFRQSAHEGGKVVSPTHRPPLPPRKYSW